MEKVNASADKTNAYLCLYICELNVKISNYIKRLATGVGSTAGEKDNGKQAGKANWVAATRKTVNLTPSRGKFRLGKCFYSLIEIIS